MPGGSGEPDRFLDWYSVKSLCGGVDAAAPPRFLHASHIATAVMVGSGSAVGPGDQIALEIRRCSALAITTCDALTLARHDKGELWLRASAGRSRWTIRQDLEVEGAIAQLRQDWPELLLSGIDGCGPRHEAALTRPGSASEH
jgi:hypothetical protein